jgi:predicted nucleotidyltransferase
MTEQVVRVEVPDEEIARFCRDWGVTEMSLFGSALRDDFGPQSDIDVLLTFGSGVRPTLFDLVRMGEELTRIFGRRVDVVSRRGLEASRNPIRRKAILESARVIYESRPHGEHPNA